MGSGDAVHLAAWRRPLETTDDVPPTRVSSLLAWKWKTVEDAHILDGSRTPGRKTKWRAYFSAPKFKQQ